MRTHIVPLFVLTAAMLGTSSGCGLVLQGTSSKVGVVTEPAGVRVSVGGQTYSAPVSLTLRRNTGALVVRAAHPGYRDACRILDVQRDEMSGLLFSLDVLSLGGVLVDGLAGTLPSHYPDSVHIVMEPGPEEDFEPLPTDDELLSYWRSGAFDRCLQSRSLTATANLENWFADFKPALRSVTVDGKIAGKVQRAGENAQPLFIFQDNTLTLTVAPQEDTIDLRIGNRTERSLKVRWADAVFVDFDHTSHAIGRVKLEGSPAPQASSVIAPGTLGDETAFPQSRVYEASTSVHTTDQPCVQSCQQIVYQCMSANNCSGYRSRQPYTGEGWLLVAFANGLDAGLCERRCLDQLEPCVGSCDRTITRSEGLQHLPIVPSLPRPCGQSQDDFTRAAQAATPQTYAILLPVETAGTVREYMLNFEGSLFQYRKHQGCPR